MAAACARPSPERVAPLHAVEISTYARLLRMADVRELDPMLVEGGLAAESPIIRSAAAIAVGQVRGTPFGPRLRAMLRDPDTTVAATAAFALGLLRDTASIPDLAASLTVAGTVAAEAAWALGQAGEPARLVIERALANHELPPDVLGALLLAAARLRPVPSAAAVAHLAHRNPDVRWRALYVLARPVAPAGARPALTAARDTSHQVRALAARTLAVQAAGDSLRLEALTTLARLVRDAHPHVRINAVRALATYGGVARQTALALSDDPDANVRIAVAQSAGAVLDSGRAGWLALWSADTGFAYRRSVLASALRAGASLEIADPGSDSSWARAADWRLRVAVAEAAGGGGADRIRRNVVPLLSDVDGRVRAAAYGAVGAFADSLAPSWRTQYLLPGLRDADPFVRATVLAALAAGAAAEELPAVLAAYRLAQGDSTNDARVAAVRYLASAWRRDSAAISDSLRRAIASLPAPADPLVRAEGAGIPVLEAWTHAPGTGRALPWYEERVRRIVLPALAGRLPTVEIVTERGSIVLELLSRDAPLTVDNFLSLARARFYDGLRFHRVVPNFVAQDGDPRGDGNGGPDYAIRDELNRHRYGRGTVGMALSGPDTGGSQYFITHSPQPHLDGGYTVFGRVIIGLDVLDRVVQGDRIERVRIR